jgi:hypothetical protein
MRISALKDLLVALTLFAAVGTAGASVVNAFHANPQLGAPISTSPASDNGEVTVIYGEVELADPSIWS